jgi:hypothetical protein
LSEANLLSCLSFAARIVLEVIHCSPNKVWMICSRRFDINLFPRLCWSPNLHLVWNLLWSHNAETLKKETA